MYEICTGKGYWVRVIRKGLSVNFGEINLIGSPGNSLTFAAALLPELFLAWAKRTVLSSCGQKGGGSLERSSVGVDLPRAGTATCIHLGPEVHAWWVLDLTDGRPFV